MTRLVIVRQKYTASGGAERFVSRALEALRSSDLLDVSLIARKWERLDGIRAFVVNPFYLGNVWRDWSFARAAHRLWQREGFDLVQSHERIPGCDIYRAGDGVHRHWLQLRRRSLSTLGCWVLAANPYHHYVKWMERRMFLHPALKLVICNSHMVKREIQHYFGLPDACFAVIYNGVDTSAFNPGLRQQYRSKMRGQWQIPEAAPLLLYVGSGFERKGVARALQAIAPLSDVYLMVVGKDKHASRYQRLAARLGLSGRVRFTGAQNDVKPFYGMADAFLLPTLYDPFPNVCIEALACGLPLFTTKQCGAAELIRPGENGWVTDALDIPALTAAIRSWLQPDTDQASLRQQARVTAEPLTLNAMAALMLAHYQRLLPEAAAAGTDLESKVIESQ